MAVAVAASVWCHVVCERGRAEAAAMTMAVAILVAAATAWSCCVWKGEGKGRRRGGGGERSMCTYSRHTNAEASEVEGWVSGDASIRVWHVHWRRHMVKEACVWGEGRERGGERGRAGGRE